VHFADDLLGRDSLRFDDGRERFAKSPTPRFFVRARVAVVCELFESVRPDELRFPARVACNTSVVLSCEEEIKDQSFVLLFVVTYERLLRNPLPGSDVGADTTCPIVIEVLDGTPPKRGRRQAGGTVVAVPPFKSCARHFMLGPPVAAYIRCCV